MIPFYWINLDKDIARRQATEKLLGEYKNIRIPGLLCSDRELGCTLSHLKAIKCFLQSTDEYGVICEDDISLEYQKYWRTDVDGVVKNAPKDWEILQISLTVHGETINKFYTAPEYLPHSAGHYSTVAYIINRNGANKIAAHFFPGVADKVLYRIAKTYTYKYPLFTHIDDAESNIHPENVAGHLASKAMIRKFLEND